MSDLCECDECRTLNNIHETLKNEISQREINFSTYELLRFFVLCSVSIIYVYKCIATCGKLFSVRHTAHTPTQPPPQNRI